MSAFGNWGGLAASDDFLTNPSNPTRRMFLQMERREREQNARAGHGDFLSDPNHPTRRLFRQMEQREREQNARAGHGDFLSDPNHATRRLFRQMEQRETEQNARAGHGDFLSDPNHPTRRLFRQMEQSDPHSDFLTNPSNPIRRGLAAMHRRGPHQGVPVAATHLQQTQGHFNLPPACLLTPPAEPESRDCSICLEALQGGQHCCRPPCLHTFHNACLNVWSQHSSKCPLCNLDLKGPPTTLRYRLKEIASLKASELRYLAAHLSIDIRALVERTSLESAVLGSRHVHLLSCREELQSLTVGRLKSLVKGVSAQGAIGLVEKSELVESIMSSNRFEEEHAGSACAPSTAASGGTSTTSNMPLVVGELETALEASMQEADARAAVVNGPLSSAILHSRLVPDSVVLLEVDRTLSTLRNALLAGDELANVRDALESHGHAVELLSGVKVFVRPEQYNSVITAVEDMDLKPRHIVVSQELEHLVVSVIGAVKRTTVKRRRVTTTQPSFCIWRGAKVSVEVKRTFIHLEIPSSLPSGPSSKHAASA